MRWKTILVWILGISTGFSPRPGMSGSAQQVADSAFSPPIHEPAFAPGAGPLILIDEAHFNFHTAGGRYLAFSTLLRRDGYGVEPSRSRFTRDVLEEADILVISNALAEADVTDWSLPTESAFEQREIEAVRGWVFDGGSLMLIADHMPMPGAAEGLAAAFGLLFNNGFAMDPEEGSGALTFRRSDGSLADHPITNGRGPEERVDSVVTFTGQAFWAPADVHPLLVVPPGYSLLLPEVAWAFTDDTPRLSAEGMLQGAVLRYGRGRVAAFGEAAMFSAQLGGAERVPVGMNAPEAAQNYRFLLNVVHWLSGMLDGDGVVHSVQGAYDGVGVAVGRASDVEGGLCR